MTEVPAFSGQLDITAVAVGNPFVGIASGWGSSVSVTLSQVTQVWDVTSQPSGSGLRFSISGYPYTGVDSQGNIISTTDESQDVAWFTTYFPDQSGFTIASGNNESYGWLIYNASDPESPIVLGSLDQYAPPIISPYQLFYPKPLDDVD